MMPEKGAICDKLYLSRTHSESLLRTHRTSPANSPNYSCELTELFLRTHRISPVNSPNHSCGYTDLSSPQRFYNEPSPSQRRRLVKSMTSLRQLVESKGTVGLRRAKGSVNPQISFSESKEKLHSLPIIGKIHVKCR